MRKSPYIKYYGTGSFPIYFGFTMDEVAFNKEMKRLGLEGHPGAKSGYDGATHVLTKEGCTNTIIVFIRIRKDITKSQVIAMIAHEAVHVWQKINEAMGCECPGGEHAAYGIQYFTQVMVREFLREKEKK